MHRVRFDSYLITLTKRDVSQGTIHNNILEGFNAALNRGENRRIQTNQPPILSRASRTRRDS